MSAAPQLRRLVAVDADTGEAVSPEVAALQERVAELEATVKDLEKDMRVKRGMITKLKKDKIQERLGYARREDVERVHSYWQRRLGHQQALTADRFDAVRGLLDEQRIVVVNGSPVKMDAFDIGDFKAAIDGAHYDPFITTLKNGRQKRHDDLALICRDGKTFQSFIDRAPVRDPS